MGRRALVLARCLPAASVVWVAACGRLDFDPITSADGSTSPEDAATDASAFPTPLHQYRLEGSYADDFGGPPLAARGGQLVAGGYQFSPNQGLTVFGALPPLVYTVDITFWFDQLTSWRKILDFNHLTKDTGLYVFDSSLQFVVVPNPNGVFQTSPVVFTPRTQARVTLSRDAAGTVTGSVNGVAMISFDDSTAKVAARDTAEAHFFVDDNTTTGGEASGGIVRRIRIYDVPLDASRLGP